MMAFVILNWANMVQQNHLTQRQRKPEDNDLTFYILLSWRQQAHRSRYLAPRLPRHCMQLKIETFNQWFQETDRTWLTVVSLILI